MKSRLAVPVLCSVLTVSACSTAPPPAVDPSHDPTIVGAVSGAVEEGAKETAANGGSAATTGRRVGTAVGVFAAIFGGGPYESLDDSIDRFRRVRAAGEAIGTVVGVSQAASKGWQHGSAFDIQMAELQKIERVEVTRPAVDQIDVQFPYSESAPLREIACVIGNGEGRSIDVEAHGDLAFDVREGLIEQGLPASLLESHRNQEVSGVVLHVRRLPDGRR